MAKAQMGGYRSPVDTGLGQVPSTQDADLFNELTSVYNAIHLLNEHLDKVRTNTEGGDSSQSPADTAGFQRYFWAAAIDTIPINKLVSPFTSGSTSGMRLGVSNRSWNAGVIINSNTFTGYSLSAAAPGELFKVGVGPAIIAMAGVVSGQYVFGVPSGGGDGTIYTGSPGSIAIGQCIENGFVILSSTGLSIV